MMTGWKTWAGGAGMILSGLAMVATAVSQGTLDGIQEGVALIGAGLGTIGIGHKIEKALGIG